MQYPSSVEQPALFTEMQAAYVPHRFKLYEPKPLPYPPRPYQEEARLAVEVALASGKRRPMIELPTGSGKTYLLTLIALMIQAQYGGEASVLIVVPWLDLVSQTEKDLLQCFQSPDLGVIQGERNDLGRRITLASVATITKSERLTSFVASLRYPIRAILIDEAHRGLCKSIQEMLQVLDPAHEIAVIGMTATPYRADEQSLAQVFWDGIIYSKDFLELVLEGYLVRPVEEIVETDLDLTEEDIQELEQALDGPITDKLQKKLQQTNRYKKAYERWAQRTKGKRKTLVFAQNIKDAYACCEYFVKQGVTAVVVTGKIRNRKPLLDRFEPGGDIQVIVNVGVFTTGINLPWVECIIMLAALNRGLWTQCMGRGMRPCKEIGKKVCYIINATDKRHTLMSMGKLLGKMDGAVRDGYVTRVYEEAVQLLKDQGISTDVDLPIGTLLQKAISYQRDVFTGGGWTFSQDTHEATKDFGTLGLLLARQELTGYVVFHKTPRGHSTRLFKDPLPIQQALATGQRHMVLLEHQAKLHQDAKRHSSRVSEQNRLDLEKPISKGQWRYFRNRGVNGIGPDAEHSPLTHRDYILGDKFLKRYGQCFVLKIGRLVYDPGQHQMCVKNAQGLIPVTRFLKE